ncbi:CvpA family protein [Thiocystis violacea]|uniref:CvpA family protein n=1 Tax=Thiocystis violacea TaxID=13725 RepID=UPI001906F1F3|nr:CvpA family protein [Thiocystis violacea]MBK1717921.1 colicin V production CvpA [Thiocystis violacea]
MNWVDYAILAIILLSALVGVARGLIREVLSLGTWILALAVAWLFHKEVANLLVSQLSDPSVRIAVAFLGLVLLTLVLGAILAAVLTAVVDKVGLTSLDRLLGFAFGGARGVLLVAMAVFLVALTPIPSDPMWRESTLIGEFQTIGGWFLDRVPPELQTRLKQI